MGLCKKYSGLCKKIGVRYLVPDAAKFSFAAEGSGKLFTQPQRIF